MYRLINFMVSDLMLLCVDPFMFVLRIILTHWVRPEQNGCHLADNIFEWIYFNEIFCNLIQISLKRVSIGAEKVTRHDMNQSYLVYLILS